MERTRQQDMTERAKRAHQELKEKAGEWGISVEDVDLSLPTLKRREDGRVRGLPPGTRTETLDDGSVRFQIARIEVRTDRARKRILLTDTEILTTLLIDLERATVSGQADVVVEISDKDHLSFEVQESSYRGEVFYGREKPRLELNIEGVSETVSLEL